MADKDEKEPLLRRPKMAGRKNKKKPQGVGFVGGGSAGGQGGPGSGGQGPAPGGQGQGANGVPPPFINFDEDLDAGIGAAGDPLNNVPPPPLPVGVSNPARSFGTLLSNGLLSNDPLAASNALASLQDLFKKIAPAKQIELLEQINKNFARDNKVFIALAELDDLKAKFKTYEADDKKYNKKMTVKNDTQKSASKKALVDSTLGMLKRINDTADLKQEWVEVIETITKPHVMQKTDKKGNISDVLENGQKVLVGNVFSTEVLTASSENPSTIEIRDLLSSANYGIAQAMFVSPKGGGKNNPGVMGGNYVFPIQTPSGKIIYPMIFFKQATDFENEKINGNKVKVGHQNYQENIAEIIGGRIMNDLVGDISAPTFGTPTPGATTSGKGEVYIGSVFHAEFQDFHSVAFEGEPEKFKRGNIKKKILGVISSITSRNLAKFFAGTGPADAAAAHLRRTFGIASSASLLVGNYQIHSENLGKGRTSDGKISAVSLDYGGAGRRPYAYRVPLLQTQTMVKHGRFERIVDPLVQAGKKYREAYLRDYPESTLNSKEFIEGNEYVGNISIQKMHDAINSAVDYAIARYGKDIFYEEYAKNLDTRVDNNGKRLAFKSSAGVDTETKAFLIDAQMGRQLSIKEFALEQKLKTDPASHMTEMVNQHPAYAIFNDLDKEYKTKPLKEYIDTSATADIFTKLYIEDTNVLAITSADEAVRQLTEIMLTRMKVAEMTLKSQSAIFPAELANVAQERNDLNLFMAYIENAKSTYEFDSPNDQRTLIQAIDHAAKLMKDITHKLTPALQSDFQQQQEFITPTLPPASKVSEKDANLRKFANELITNGNNFRYKAPPYGGKPKQRVGLFAPAASHASAPSPILTTLLQTYITNVTPYIAKDAAVRDSLAALLHSHVGTVFRGDTALLDRINSPLLALPPNVIRSNLRPIYSPVPLTFDQLGVAAVNSQVLARNQSAVVYVSNPANPVTATNMETMGAYKEQRNQNGSYSIKALQLPQKLTKTHSINEALHASGNPAAVALMSNSAVMRELVKAYRDYLNCPPDASRVAKHTKVEQLLQNNIPGVDANKLIDEFNKNVIKNGMQNISGKNISSDEYLEYAHAQIQSYLGENGSNHAIKIQPSNEPDLALAYQIVCLANGLVIDNASGFDLAPDILTPEIKAHITTKFPIDNQPQLQMANLLGGLTGKVNDPGVSTALAGFKTEADAGKPVTYNNLYRLVDTMNEKLAVATRAVPRGAAP